MHKSDELSVIKGDSYNLGQSEIGKSIDSYKSYKMRYSTKDRIYIMSDGLENQSGGSDVELFGCQQVTNLLQRIQEQPFNNQQVSIASDFNKWKDQVGVAQEDDLLVIGIEV